MPLLKTSVPRFEGTETAEERLELVMRYLHSLQEQLQYTLGHLNAGNINGAGFALDIRSGNGKTERGRLGAVGDGVGLLGGGASVTVEGGAVYLKAGKYGVKVGPDGVFRSADGGENWTEWKEEGNETA